MRFIHIGFLLRKKFKSSIIGKIDFNDLQIKIDLPVKVNRAIQKDKNQKILLKSY